MASQLFPKLNFCSETECCSDSNAPTFLRTKFKLTNILLVAENVASANMKKEVATFLLMFEND